MKLTDLAVKSAVCPKGKVQLELIDEGYRGLILVIGQRSKAWQVRFSLAAAGRQMVLGKYPALSRFAARAAASGSMLLVDQGRDLREDASTVSDAGTDYWKAKAPTFKHPAHDEACWASHIAPPSAR